MPTLIERFEEKFRRGEPGECWDWVAATNGRGYGKFSVKGRLLLAHRVAHMLYSGPVPEHLCVLHHCDNRRCVNPAHLFVGTHKDNATDAAQKGRTKWPGPKNPARGERQGGAKLTRDGVMAIRNAHGGGESLSSISRRFGVCLQTISDVVNRRTWRHVEG